jgi:mannose-1-phosphate guanylyltransferase
MNGSGTTWGNTWAIVLAAGDGSRLHSLTTTESGIAIPKQFCSLHGGQSLLREALQRAEAVASPANSCIVVAHHHKRWWDAELAGKPKSNVIVQPSNQGTANGILLPMLHNHHCCDADHAPALVRETIYARAGNFSDEHGSLVPRIQTG